MGRSILETHRGSGGRTLHQDGRGSLTHRKAHMAFTRNGEQYLALSGSPRAMSSRKQSLSMNEKRKVLSQAKKDETRSDTIPSPASAVHGWAFTLTWLSASASASIFSSLGSLVPLDPDAEGDQGRSSSASLMDLQTASGSSESRMRERMSWASGLDFCRRRPKSSRSRSFSSWRLSHFRFKADVRLTLASSTS